MTQKEKILKILEGNRDCVVSGQQLADQLGISRAAVWKAIKSLQGAGYVISAKTNGGYALQAVNDIVSRSAVEVCLGYPLKDAYFFDEVDSTNNFALTLAQNGVAEGALVVATQQSNGKGRVGKSFVSPKGGIYMSVVLRPNCPLAEATLLTPMAAVAVAKAIRKLCNVDAKIKWVNDIYLDGKKICGILTQAVTDFENEHVAAVVVGIGINFDTPASAFDGELACKARSIFCAEQAKTEDIKTEQGNREQSTAEQVKTQQINAEQPTVTKSQLIAEVYGNLVELNVDFNSKKFMQDYRQLSVVVGKQIFYEFNSQQCQGIVLDIDDDGRLVVQTSGGIITVNCGEISIKL